MGYEVSFSLPRQRSFSTTGCLFSYKHIREKESHPHTPTSAFPTWNALMWMHPSCKAQLNFTRLVKLTNANWSHLSPFLQRATQYLLVLQYLVLSLTTQKRERWSWAGKWYYLHLSLPGCMSQASRLHSSCSVPRLIVPRTVPFTWLVFKKDCLVNYIK